MTRSSGGGKPLAQSYFALDLRWLHQNGYTRPGAKVTLEQSLGQHLLGVVDVMRIGNHQFRLRSEGREAHVRLVFTEQPFGGDRPWFSCPSCGGRCAVLYGLPARYGPRFACRACRGLAYQSQRESPRIRPALRARKIRERLGGDGNITKPVPAKPYGMHATTYRRLCAQLSALNSCISARF